MLDELLDIFSGGDDDGDRRRRRPDRSARQGGIRGFISRLMGSDDDDAPVDERDARRRGRDSDDDADSYERSGRRHRRDRDRDDDGWFDFGD